MLSRTVLARARAGAAQARCFFCVSSVAAGASSPAAAAAGAGSGQRRRTLDKHVQALLEYQSELLELKARERRRWQDRQHLVGVVQTAAGPGSGLLIDSRTRETDTSTTGGVLAGGASGTDDASARQDGATGVSTKTSTTTTTVRRRPAMNKTIRVLTYHYFVYPKLRIRVKRRRSILAHDEFERAREGDLVTIVPTHKPISRRKKHVLKDILRRVDTEGVAGGEEWETEVVLRGRQNKLDMDARHAERVQRAQEGASKRRKRKKTANRARSPSPTQTPESEAATEHTAFH